MNYFILALRNIKHRKLRASLTIIGIVIGIAAIISLISISQGFQNALTAQFMELGAGRIFIMPEGNFQNVFAGGLTKDDVKVLEGIAELDWVSPYAYTSGSAIFSDQEKTVPQFIGYGTSELERVLEDAGYNILEGRFIKSGEKGSVFIGEKFANSLFDKKVRIGNKIEIKGKKFKVVGILENQGSPQDDNGVYMNIDDFRSLFNKEDYMVIETSVKEGADIKDVAKKIETKLEKARNNDNFQVYTPEQLMQQFNTILDIVKVVLVAIAAISLVVGGIGIMNSMYTSVMERTREIGIMKSIGAKRDDILKLFLFESGILGLTGGLMGVLFGVVISFMVEFIAKSSGFKFMDVKFEIWLYIGGMIFAFIIGMLSGFLPSKEATDLQPVEALRYGT